MYKNFLKRFLDFLVALSFLLILSPVFITITIISFFLNGSPFFTQKRPGKNEKIFSVLKFKTMTDKKDENGVLLPDDKRLTKFGSILRKTSLDEIPQLINVLNGDMSLIGPRPLLIEYLPLYNKQEAKRHDIRPGITGWAQVNGRNAISWQKKFELDIWYVKNISIGLDIKIIFLTIKKVLKREGVNVSQDLSMSKFKGHK